MIDNTKKRTIIYIGGFELPDRNAAAHRVLNNSRMLRALGYNVVLAGIDRDSNVPVTEQGITWCQGFARWSIMHTNRRLYSINDFIFLYKKYRETLLAVIAYNYPAIALQRMHLFCRKRGVKVIADCTEWYGFSGNTLVRKLITGIDSYLRMNLIQPTLDGIIVISSYLERYYRKKLPTICIPPLTDVCEYETIGGKNVANDGIEIVYAGSPGKHKDKVNKIIEAIANCTNTKVHFTVIGISKEHFLEYYPEDEEVVASLGERVSFLGKMSHKDVLLYLKRADFSIFYRAKTRVTMAGFPTKFSESISCGTPVITNLTSDLSAYLKDGINGFIIEENIDRSLKEILSIGTMNLKVLKKNVNKSLFDYHNYIVPFAEWFNIIIYNESN